MFTSKLLFLLALITEKYSLVKYKLFDYLIQTSKIVYQGGKRKYLNVGVLLHIHTT